MASEREVLNRNELVRFVAEAIEVYNSDSRGQDPSLLMVALIRCFGRERAASVWDAAYGLWSGDFAEEDAEEMTNGE